MLFFEISVNDQFDRLICHKKLSQFTFTKQVQSTPNCYYLENYVAKWKKAQETQVSCRDIETMPSATLTLGKVPELAEIDSD